MTEPAKPGLAGRRRLHTVRGRSSVAWFRRDRFQVTRNLGKEFRIVFFTLVFFLVTPVVADQDPNRPTDRIAADLGIEEDVFIECFKPVNPEPDKYPSGQEQRANKAILLPCLQKANPAISNERLDRVMDRYRPEGAFRK